MSVTAWGPALSAGGGGERVTIFQFVTNLGAGTSVRARSPGRSNAAPCLAFFSAGHHRGNGQFSWRQVDQRRLRGSWLENGRGKKQGGNRKSPGKDSFRNAGSRGRASGGDGVSSASFRLKHELGCGYARGGGPSLLSTPRRSKIEPRLDGIGDLGTRAFASNVHRGDRRFAVWHPFAGPIRLCQEPGEGRGPFGILLKRQRPPHPGPRARRSEKASASYVPLGTCEGENTRPSGVRGRESRLRFPTVVEGFKGHPGARERSVAIYIEGGNSLSLASTKVPFQGGARAPPSGGGERIRERGKKKKKTKKG